MRGTKTRRERYVPLLEPLAQDLREWRLASGRPDNGPILPRRKDALPWTRNDWKRWRRDKYVPAAEAAG